MKSARNTKARRKIARRSPPLSLSMRVERLEKTLLLGLIYLTPLTISGESYTLVALVR